MPNKKLNFNKSFLTDQAGMSNIDRRDTIICFFVSVEFNTDFSVFYTLYS